MSVPDTTTPPTPTASPKLTAVPPSLVAAARAYYAALEADAGWAGELRRVFGKEAGGARYDDRGVSTPELRRLCDAKLAADAALRGAA